MGDRIFSSDMILSQLVQPMERAYSMRNYEVAARNLEKLKRFLKGFGEGITDMPDLKDPRPEMQNDIKSRVRQQPTFISQCKIYYDTYCADVFERLGIYIRAEIDALDRANNPYRS